MLAGEISAKNLLKFSVRTAARLFPRGRAAASPRVRPERRRQARRRKERKKIEHPHLSLAPPDWYGTAAPCSPPSLPRRPPPWRPRTLTPSCPSSRGSITTNTLRTPSPRSGHRRAKAGAGGRPYAFAAPVAMLCDMERTEYAWRLFVDMKRKGCTPNLPRSGKHVSRVAIGLFHRMARDGVAL